MAEGCERGGEGCGEGGTGGDPAEVPELSGQLVFGVGGGELGLAVFGEGKGQCGGDGKGEGQREWAQFEAREGGEDQADGRADEEGLLAPPRMGAEGAGDVQRDEYPHEERSEEGREQGTHWVVPRERWFTEDGGAEWWF